MTYVVAYRLQRRARSIIERYVYFVFRFFQNYFPWAFSPVIIPYNTIICCVLLYPLGIDARKRGLSGREGMANFQEKKNGANNIILLLLLIRP